MLPILSDLDKDIASGKQSLDDILGRGDFTQTPEHPRLGVNPPGEFSSMFKYSSTTRRMNPDGVSFFHILNFRFWLGKYPSIGSVKRGGCRIRYFEGTYILINALLS